MTDKLTRKEIEAMILHTHLHGLNKRDFRELADTALAALDERDALATAEAELREALETIAKQAPSAQTNYAWEVAQRALTREVQKDDG